MRRRLDARKKSGTWTYYQFDLQGSVAQRSNTSGSVTSSSKYDAYGKHVTLPGSLTDVYAWNGGWGYFYDTGTGLYLCQQRYYDSNQGRWLNRDPIGYAGGVNVYGYCGSAPIGGIDPSGLVRVVAYWYEVGGAPPLTTGLVRPAGGQIRAGNAVGWHG